MKDWVGVAELKMSPGRIVPLSNNRRLTKHPFTGPLLHLLHPHPTNIPSHNLYPLLSSQPTYSEPATVATEDGPPLQYCSDGSKRGAREE